MVTVFEPDVPGTLSKIPTMAIFGLVLYGSALETLTKPCLSARKPWSNRPFACDSRRWIRSRAKLHEENRRRGVRTEREWRLRV